MHCIHLNNLCPCFCAGILLSRSFDARDAPNKPYFQWKLTDSLSNIFNSLPAIFCTAEVLSLLLLRKLQLHSITAIRKLKCTNPLKKQPAVNAAHKGFGTQNTPNATAFCSSRSPMPFLNPNPLSQKTANSAGFKTGRNAAITQSKRNATLLFEAQFAFSNSVPHFFRFRIWCSSYALSHFCNLELKTHQIRPDFALSHRFHDLKDDIEQKTARFRHKKKNIFQSPI